MRTTIKRFRDGRTLSVIHTVTSAWTWTETAYVDDVPCGRVWFAHPAVNIDGRVVAAWVDHEDQQYCLSEQDAQRVIALRNQASAQAQARLAPLPVPTQKPSPRAYGYAEEEADELAIHSLSGQDWSEEIDLRDEDQIGYPRV